MGFASEDAIKGLFEDVDTTSNRLGGTVAERIKIDRYLKRDCRN